MMKKVMIFLCAGLFVASVFAGEADRRELQGDLRDVLAEQYGSIERSPLPSGVFYELAAPISDWRKFDGSTASPSADFETWVQIAHELRRASLVEIAIPEHAHWRELRSQASRDGVIPIALLVYEYQAVADSARGDELFIIENGEIAGVRADLLKQSRVFSAAVLYEKIYHGSSTRLRFDADQLILTNLKERIARLEVNFDDGRGFREVAQTGTLEVSYTSTGTKSLALRATLASGEILHASTRLEVISLDAPPPTETWQLAATNLYQGVQATGEAYVYLSDLNPVLTKPMILVEGLDLDNTRNWDQLYDLMNQQLLLENLRALGFDAVVLNYTNSTVAMQANGFLVEELIAQVNAVTGGAVEGVIVGTSLGGLTTRYALMHMEQNEMDHHIRNFISMDSPQRGADIPIGLQYWVDFFADLSAEAAQSRDALNSPVAKQLLLYHFSSSSGGTANPDPLRAVMNNELNTMGGYPQALRKVAVCNGSSTMQNSGFNGGAQIIQWTYRSLLLDIDGNVWAVSNSVNTRVFQGGLNYIWPLPDTYRNVNIAPCLSWDNAPGGKTATMAELAAVDPGYGDIVAPYPSHCFIPAVSALDLNTADPFFNIAGEPNLHAMSPFDSLYFPVANQDHVAITPENAMWLTNEIIGPLAAPQVVIKPESSSSVRLSWPPIFAATQYKVFESADGATWPLTYTSVTDTTALMGIGGEMGFFRVEASR